MSTDKSNQLKILHSFLRYPHGENPISHIIKQNHKRNKKEKESKRCQQTLLLLKNMTPASRDDGLSLR